MFSQRYLCCFYGFTETVNLGAVIITIGTYETGHRKSAQNGGSADVLGGERRNPAASCAREVRL